MKKLKRIITGVVGVILALILLFNIYNFINIKILKNDLTTVFGYSVLEVVSGSMEPTIKKGDLIIIKVKNFEYHPGDIVTFTDVEGSFVTHRIVMLQRDKMTTKGDNNNTEDESLPAKNIIGKYMFRIAGFGTILQTIKNPVVSIMIFVIGVLICYVLVDNEENKVVPLEEQAEYDKYLVEKKKNRQNKKKR